MARQTDTRSKILDLAEELLDYIASSRTKDVVYFNPTDQDFPIGLNVLAQAPGEQRHLIVSGLISTFKSLWRESWGPRMEYILSNALAALLDCKNSSLLGIITR